MTLLLQIPVQVPSHVTAVSTLQLTRTVDLISGVHQASKQNPREMASIHSLQEPRHAALMHYLHHLVTASARTMHTVVVRHDSHGAAHVRELLHKARTHHVVACYMSPVHLLQPVRGAMQSSCAGLNSAPIPVHIPAE
jgi:hypothetical protein